MKILITGGSGFIGSNFHEYIKNNSNEISIINVDIVKPKLNFSNSIWEKCDILDKDKLLNVANNHQPDIVIHFAAETSCEDGLALSDYTVNTQGSQNVFEVAEEVDSISTLVHTSTQFINQFDFPLKDFFNYKPHTVYGESKIISEKLLINGGYKFNWIIIRPSNIWGKWHLRYPNEFWKVLKEEKYFHPNMPNVIRSYGYVGNVCDQIYKFVNRIGDFNKQIFYVGDEPTLLYNWVNGFSLAITGKKVRTLPPIFVRLLAIFGDVLGVLKINFPITSSRYRSMTTSNPAPMEKTFKAIGKPKYGLSEGIDETVSWLRAQQNF